MKPVWLGADQESAAVARSPEGHPWDYEFNEIRESEQREKGSGRLEGSWEMLWPSQRPTVFVWYSVLMLETVPPPQCSLGLWHGVGACGSRRVTWVMLSHTQSGVDFLSQEGVISQ